MTNPFFKNKGPFKVNKLLKLADIKHSEFISNKTVNDIKDLISSESNNITFFHSKKYSSFAANTKASFCITTESLQNFLPKKCNKIIVKNVLVATSKITKIFYPDSVNDDFDNSIKEINKTKFKKKVKFGKNVLIGKKVSIGKNSIIGHNSIIESNVKIGPNTIIGNNVLIKNTIMGKNVRVLDGTIIGKKGFGFFPGKNINFRYPHIGMVIIKDNVEIGCNNTIDRGSLSNTIIGKNTFIDNQVHIAHNVNIGDNCIITGQVGFAGSSTIGNRVLIGGQAGISGHLKIGDNVQIGGGSGVIKNIPDNSKVMGYPAKDIRKFLKDNM